MNDYVRNSERKDKVLLLVEYLGFQMTIKYYLKNFTFFKYGGDFRYNFQRSQKKLIPVLYFLLSTDHINGRQLCYG